MRFNSVLTRGLAWSTLLGLLSCKVRSDVEPVPTFGARSELSGMVPLNTKLLQGLDGIYVSDAAPFRGAIVGHGSSSTFSLFTSQDSTHVIFNAGCSPDGTRFLAEGYFRRATLGTGGLVRLRATGLSARTLCADRDSAVLAAVSFTGEYGNDNQLPDKPFTLKYKRERAGEQDFGAIAHHGACRTIDACGYSENSIESMLRVPAFGARAVEVDVRLTRDGIPVLFHDETLAPRLVNGELCHGRIADFTLEVLRANCTLQYGEQIPTLQEAVDAVIASKDLRGLWVDIKETAALLPSVAILHDAVERTSKPLKTHLFVVGLPDEEVRQAYLQIPTEQRAPCFLELEPDDVRATGCSTWAPRWTRGASGDEVQQLKSQGIGTVLWTVNEVPFIDTYLQEVKPTSMLSDRVGTVLYRRQLLLGALGDTP